MKLKQKQSKKQFKPRMAVSPASNTPTGAKPCLRLPDGARLTPPSLKKKISTNPSIKSLEQDLVAMRCANDVVLNGSTMPYRPARHSCAIFVEKNQSCFKPTIVRYQSRELCPERKLKKRPICSQSIPISESLLQLPFMLCPQTNVVF